VTEQAYLLGHRPDELERLINQARFVEQLTEHALRRAGLMPGARVLDVGCGPGDMSFLVARLVGPAGWVLGVDQAVDAVRTARSRAAGLGNVHFAVADLAGDALPLREPVDALTGRLILMHLPDPAAVLRRLIRYVRPGGLVVFQEMNLGGASSEPACPLFDTAMGWVLAAFARAGVSPRAGLRLCQVFQDAGLPAPRMLLESRVDGGPDSPAYQVVAEVVRTLLPAIERTGVASAAEIDIGTLAQRLRAEAVARRAVLVAPPLVAAWARVA
jgi:SAM-dependent methyltransferase